MADPITAAGQNVSKASIDLNKDGLLDSVELVWEQTLKTVKGKDKKTKDKKISWEPAVTARIDVRHADGQDEYVLVEGFDFMNACGTMLRSGGKIPDNLKRSGDVDRVVTGFSVRAKKEPNPKTGIPEYAISLYMNLMPQKADNSHRQSTRAICGPFFNPALFQSDPNREPDRNPVASKHF